MARIVPYATAIMLIGALLIGGPTMVLQNTVATDHESVTITREPLPDSKCGDLLQVALAISWAPEAPQSGAISVEETYPSGWTVSSTTGGGSTDTQGKVKWFTTDPSVEYFNYTLEIPADAEGTFTFLGIYRDHNMESGEADRVVTGDTDVTVTCTGGGGGGDPGPEPEPEPGEGASNVSRRAVGPQECAVKFTVFLDLDWGAARDGATLAIEETYPTGWSVEFPSNGGQVSGGQIKWFLTNPDLTDVNYKLTPPAESSGTFMFHGEFRDDTMDSEESNAAVGGDQDVAVTCGSPPETASAAVTRDEIINTECGTSLDVQLLITWNDAEDVIIEEGHPAGWTVTSASNGGSTDTADQIKWFLSDPSVTVVSYTLEVPADAAGDFFFTGIFRDSTMVPGDPDQPISGDGDVAITCPEPEPEPEGSVSRSVPPICRGPFTVTLTVDPPAGTDAWLVDEVPPAGLGVTDISDGGEFNETQGKIKWVDTEGGPAVLTYTLVIPESTPAGTTYTWDGTYRFDPSMASREAVTGTLSATTDCADLHPFDADENCVFGDSELFGLIDAWKAEDATDDELFSGIAAWKMSPDAYCTV